MTAQQLKNSILQLAVQGKLVPQDPNDEPASVLLERITKERERLIKEKKIKKPKSTSRIFRRDGHYYESVNGGEPACIDDQIPFDIPDSWEWVRCSNLISLTSGQDLTPDKYNDKKNGIPYITGASNFNCGHVIINRWTQFPKAFAEQGNILLTCKGTIGELALLKEAQVHIARQVMAIQPIVSSLCDFLLLILEVNVQRFKTEAQSMIPGISRDVVLEALIPLPPTLEQHRMISKLKGLLPEIEKYGLKTTTLNKINSDFPVSLKKSILQHAIQGKLVPQDPNDEPASVLLERIAEERAKLGKKAAKSMSRIERRDRGTYEIFPDGSEKDISGEIPFDIPDSWEWCRLEHIALTNLGKTLDKAKNKGELHSYLCSINVYWDGIDLSNLKQARFEPDELNKYAVLPGDLLICEGGDVGRAAIWAESLPMCYQNALHRVRPYGDVSTYFLKMIIEAYKLIGTLDEVSKGMTIKHLVQTELKRLLIPVPSISEQHRIVEKLGVLMKELGVTK